MESLGYFFLDLAFVPRSWVDQQTKPIKLEPDDYRSPSAIWWRHHECALDVREFCDKVWVRCDPTGYYLREDLIETSWSDDNNHRVEIIKDDLGHLVELTVSIDIRTQYSEFVDAIIEMAGQADCVFFNYGDEAVVEPSRDIVIKAIQQHEMTHAVFDSSGKWAPN